jgi:hypothetical protein
MVVCLMYTRGWDGMVYSMHVGPPPKWMQAAVGHFCGSGCSSFSSFWTVGLLGAF